MCIVSWWSYVSFSFCPWAPSSLNKLHRHWLCNHPGPMSFVEQFRHGLAAAWAVVQRPIVDVHAHELVREVPIHVTCIFQSVSQRVLPMRQAIADALFQEPANLLHRLLAQIAADDVAA